MDLPKDYNPANDGILCFDISKMTLKETSNEALSKIMSVIRNRPKSIVVELNTYRKYVPVLIKTAFEMQETRNAAIKQIDRFSDDCADKKYKRWTDTEDLMLIDLVCRGDDSIMGVATTMGRTVSAIKTRLSYLVGVKRLSQQVAGKFIGTANGEEFQADLVGTIYKGKD